MCIYIENEKKLSKGKDGGMGCKGEVEQEKIYSSNLDPNN